MCDVFSPFPAAEREALLRAEEEAFARVRAMRERREGAAAAEREFSSERKAKREKKAAKKEKKEKKAKRQEVPPTALGGHFDTKILCA